MPRKRRCTETDSDSSDFDDGKRPHQRNAANERERARMRVLSKAFCRLKTTLPWVPADTKLSKLDTLRLATSYIAHLRAVLMDQPINNGEQFHKHPLTLTWPFSFQRQPDNMMMTASADVSTDDMSTHLIVGGDKEPQHQQWGGTDIGMPIIRDKEDYKEISYYY